MKTRGDRPLMQQEPSHIPLKRNRKSYLGALAGLVAPLWLLCLYTLSVISPEARMGTAIVALLSGGLSGVCGWLILREWEERIHQSVEKHQGSCSDVALQEGAIESINQEMEKMRLGYEHQIDLLHSSVIKSKEQVHELEIERDKKIEHIRIAYLEFEDLRKEYASLEEEYKRYQVDLQGQLSQKDALLAEYQQTIVEQRKVIEKKQTYVAKLESKVRDLMYQIRNMLQLEDPTGEPTQNYLPDPEKGKPYDFSLQLSRYLEMAEGFTGADHLGGRFLTTNSQPYTIDLRPLFDKLAHEGQKIVFVYSVSENRLLFISEAIRNHLGWSAEKVTKEFIQLMGASQVEWQEGVQSLRPGKQKIIPLSLKHKQGHEVSLDGYLGMISKGPFAQLIIGIFV